MRTVFRIFLLGFGLAGMLAGLRRRPVRRPVMQDDAGNPAPD